MTCIYLIKNKLILWNIIKIQTYITKCN